MRILVAGIAEALRDIHAAGVIHRDLKPSNVLLAPDGPRVIDFGIARAADATPLTRTGARVGSPQFMAPEQVLGRPSTPATDMFALGSLAFFAATGQTAFGDGPDAGVLFRIAHQPPDLDQCPDELRPLIARCLSKDPQERPQPADLIAELRSDPAPHPPGDWLPPSVTTQMSAYQATPPPAPLPRAAKPAARTMLLAAGAGAIATLILVGLVLAVVPDDTPSAPQSQTQPYRNEDPPTTALPSTEPTTTSPSPSPSLSLSPPAQPTKSVDLTDLEPVGGGDSSTWSTRSAIVDGHTYDHALTADVDCSASREYVISHQYRRLHVTVGLSDSSPDASPASFEITGDEKVIRTESVRIGRPVTINLDVHDFVRLSLNPHAASCIGRVSQVVLADARLEP